MTKRNRMLDERNRHTKPPASQNKAVLSQLTHWKRPWCWEGVGAGGEGDDRGWDGWMASLTWWTWVWVNSGSWWRTGRPGVLQFMGLQRVGHDWVTGLNWISFFMPSLYILEPYNSKYLFISLSPWRKELWFINLLKIIYFIFVFFGS